MSGIAEGLVFALLITNVFAVIAIRALHSRVVALEQVMSQQQGGKQ